MDRYPAASASSSVNPTSTTSTARNKNPLAPASAPTPARTPDFTTEDSGPTTATPTLGSGSGSGSRPISPTASAAFTPSAASNPISTTSARRASRNPARRGGEGQPAATLPTTAANPNATSASPGAAPRPRAPPEDGAEVVITLAPSRLGGSNLSSSVNTSYVAEADMDGKSQNKSSHPSARGVVSSDKEKKHTVEPTLRTPANTPDDERFTFKIMTQNWKDAKGPIDVVAYPPGVTSEDFVTYLQERNTLTAHTYPFLDVQCGWAVFTIAYWKQCWTSFLSPLSVIFASIAGVSLSISGWICLLLIVVFTTLLLEEFKEREQLYYQLLDHRIIINFHNVNWLKSRRVWVIFLLSFGFIIDCWDGLTIRVIYILAQTFLAYAVAAKGMFQLEDSLTSLSRANEKYLERNLSLPAYMNIDENVFRYYLWKVEHDWDRANITKKSVRFSLAPFVFGLMSENVDMNVSLLTSTSWVTRFLPFRSFPICCYNKCYASRYREEFGDFRFNLSPTITCLLTRGTCYNIIEAKKVKRQFGRKRDVDVLLIVERGCLFEFSHKESVTSPNLVVSLSSSSVMTIGQRVGDHCEIVLQAGKVKQHRDSKFHKPYTWFTTPAYAKDIQAVIRSHNSSNTAV